MFGFTHPLTLKSLSRFVFGIKRLNTKKHDLVLEVGSGQRPYFRSDVLLDKYIISHRERPLNFIIIDRPFVVADATDLPFKDKSFDYIIAKHILEHLENPEHFLKELMRVGKAGYIETPSEIQERLQGFDFHKWIVYLEDKKLILRKKDITDKPLFNGIFHKIWGSDRNYYNFWQNNPELFHTAYEWKNRIDYKIKNQKEKIPEQAETSKDVYRADFKKIIKSIPLKRKIIFKLLRIFSYLHSGRRKFNLYDLLACPTCKKDLIKKNNYLFCNRCKRKYPIIDNVPILLK